MEFTTANVEAAVQEFYNNSGKVNREVHEWLKSCQTSREAWQIVWPLFDHSKSAQVQFLASNILHYKVSRCLGEIPQGELGALKDRLVAIVAKYIGGPKSTLTRLCLTLGAFVINTVGTVWPNPLDDLATIFAPQNFPGVSEIAVLRLLVQVFGHIPEQAFSLSSVAKGQACRELQGKGQMMYSWLFNVAKTKKGHRELMLETFKALNTWMKMICIFEWGELDEFVDLLTASVATHIELNDGEVGEVAMEILSGIIGEPQAHQYPTIMLKLLDKIIPLHQASVRTIMQRDELEMASGFYGMYVAFADCHSKLVVEVCDPESSYNSNSTKNRENVLVLVQILMECSDYPGIYPADEIVSNLTISVWYSLVEDIQAYQNENEKYVRLMQVFEEVYSTLAKILVKKAQFPGDMSDWNSEEKEMFRVYRQDVCDCLTYCFELRGWSMLNELVDWTDVHLAAIDANPKEVISRWPELESLLMGIKAVAENISDETDPVVVAPMSRVFAVLYRILKLNRENKSTNPNNPKLFQAAIECISSCSGMLHMYDAVVKNILGFILEGLFQPEIITSAALAMKTLSRDCTKNLTEFTPQILTSCKQALETGDLSPNDCNRIVFCIGRFLPYLPPDQIISAVNEIFSPCLATLQNLALQQPKQELKSQLVGVLNIFSTLCLSLDGCSSSSEEEEEEEEEEEIGGGGFPDLVDQLALNNNNTSHPSFTTAAAALAPRAQPLIPVVEQILPVLIPVAEKWARDEESMESLFSIVKHTLSTIHSSSPTVLQYATQLVLISYRLNPLTSATNVAKQTLLMLGKENRAVQQHFLSEMHRSCADRLKCPATRDLDFTESYLQFLGLIMRTDVDLINSSGISLDGVLSLCIDSLIVMETQMVKAAVYLLTMSVDNSSNLQPRRTEYFINVGAQIVHKIVQAIGFSVPRTICMYFSDLILALNKHYPREWRKWLRDSLGLEGFPSPHLTQEHKTKFFNKITKERVNKRAVQDAIGEFAVASRNLSGSEYAIQTVKRL